MTDNYCLDTVVQDFRLIASGYVSLGASGENPSHLPDMIIFQVPGYYRIHAWTAIKPTNPGETRTLKIRGPFHGANKRSVLYRADNTNGIKASVSPADSLDGSIILLVVNPGEEAIITYSVFPSGTVLYEQGVDRKVGTPTGLSGVEIEFLGP